MTPAVASGGDAPTDPAGSTRPAQDPRFDLGVNLVFAAGGNVLARGISFDAAYRVAPAIRVGLYGERLDGKDNSSDTCSATGACVESQTRAGGLVALHIGPRATLDPWFGIGLGAIYFDTGVDPAYAEPDDDYRTGWSLDVAPMLGLDVRAGPVGMGLFLQFSAPLLDRTPPLAAAGLRASLRI